MNLTYQERQDITSAIVRWFNVWQRVLSVWSRPEPVGSGGLEDRVCAAERMSARKLLAAEYLGATALLDAQIVTSCGIDVLRGLEPQQ